MDETIDRDVGGVKHVTMNVYVYTDISGIASWSSHDSPTRSRSRPFRARVDPGYRTVDQIAGTLPIGWKNVRMRETHGRSADCGLMGRTGHGSPVMETPDPGLGAPGSTPAAGSSQGVAGHGPLSGRYEG